MTCSHQRSSYSNIQHFDSQALKCHGIFETGFKECLFSAGNSKRISSVFNTEQPPHKQYNMNKTAMQINESFNMAFSFAD